MALVPFFRWPIILTTWSTDWAQKHIVCYILKAMCVFSPFINATMKSRKKKGRAPSGLIYTVHSCNVFAMSFYVLGLNLSWFYFFSCNTFSWFSSFLYIYLSRQGWWRSDSLTPLCGPVGNATLCSAEFFYLDDTLEHTRKGFNSGHIGTLYPGVKSIYLGDLLFRIAFAVETYIANGCERLDPTRKRCKIWNERKSIVDEQAQQI